MSTSFFQVNGHVNTGHRGEGAKVLRFTEEAYKALTQGDITPEEAHRISLEDAGKTAKYMPRDPQPEPEEEPEEKPALEKVPGTEIPPLYGGMAHRAASNPTFYDALRDEDDEEDEDVEPEPLVIEPTISRRDAPIFLTVELQSAYDAYRGQGYTGTAQEWVHELLINYFIISGVDFHIFQIPERERARIIAEHGLRIG